MKLIKNPENKGILVLLSIILVIGGFMAITSGKLEDWFGITWFSGPAMTNKIAFVSERDGKPKLYIMSLDGEDQMPLADEVGINSPPMFSPLGTKVAFIKKVGNEEQVFSVEMNGREPDQLTNTNGAKAQPGFSPDGKYISFISSGRVYIADSKGNNLEPVLPSHRETSEATLRRCVISAYSQYAWGSDSNSMLGVRVDENGNDSLVYLPALRDEIITLVQVISDQRGNSTLVMLPDINISECQTPTITPIAPVKGRFKITGIASAMKTGVFVITAFFDGQSTILELDVSEGKLIPIQITSDVIISNPSISPDGVDVVFIVKAIKKTAKDGLVRLSLTSKTAEVVALGKFADPIFPPTGDRLIAVEIKNDRRNIIAIEPSGEVRELTTDGKSYFPSLSPQSVK